MFGPSLLPRTLEAALRDLGSRKSSVRADAVRDLVRHIDEARDRVVRGLETALRDEHASVRSAAAIALADAAGREALATLLVAVEDDDPHVRQMAITAVGEIGDSRATERLRRALSDARPEVRFQAVIAFPRVVARKSDAVEALVEATRDPDPLVRHIALRMAEEIGGDDESPVPEPLLVRARELVADTAGVVRVAAAIILARADEILGEDVLIGVVNGSVKTTDGSDEAAAIELCGEFGLEAARPGLERRAFGGVLGLGRDRFAWHARIALARMGDARAARTILRELTSWDPDRRTLAVAAAGRARLVAARELLRTLRATGRVDTRVVDDALEAIEDGPSSFGVAQP